MFGKCIGDLTYNTLQKEEKFGTVFPQEQVFEQNFLNICVE